VSKSSLERGCLRRVPHLRSIARDRDVIGNEYMVFGTVDKIYRKSDKVCKYTDDNL
jgi:hypothetical protein